MKFIETMKDAENLKIKYNEFKAACNNSYLHFKTLLRNPSFKWFYKKKRRLIHLLL
jgi:hypothetical protein